MADFTAPSFSLGLDLDFDEPEATIDLVSSQSIIEEDEDPQTLLSDLLPDSPKRPILKRLKRGLSTKPLKSVVDDEIEDISSPEDNKRDDHLVHQSRSSCSGSKVTSHGFVPLSTQCSSKSEARQASNASCLTNIEKSKNKTMFPKLTISPLRRFQLLDSDSESEDLFEDSRKADLPSSRNINAGSKAESEDLWKDFGAQNIPTPALDDFCEEYFRSVKGKNVEKSKVEDICVFSSKVCKNQSNPDPPAYKYFYHDDPRIKRLVRQRLPNFFPLGDNHTQTRQSDAPDDIDYMCQFNQKEPTSRNKGKQMEGSWVNPRNVGKSRAEAAPKNAGKRRVRAVGTCSGSWFTGEDGKKVYVSKNGKELSGRMAYLQYRKESGAGFKKSRKKGGPSKKKSKNR